MLEPTKLGTLILEARHEEVDKTSVEEDQRCISPAPLRCRRSGGVMRSFLIFR